MKISRCLVAVSLAALAPLCPAQLTSDPDVALGPYTRLAAVDTTFGNETLVAAVWGDQTHMSPVDRLLIGRYNPSSGQVDYLWQGNVGGAQINEVAIAAAGGWSGAAHPDRIYVVVEAFQDILRVPYTQTNRESTRALMLLEFDYQRGSSSLRDPEIHKVKTKTVLGGRLAFNSRLHVDLDLVGAPGTRYIPAITYAWPDGGNEIFVATPFQNRGDDRVRNTGAPMAEELIAGVGGSVIDSAAPFGHASLAVDKNADGVWIAFDQPRSDKIHIGWRRRTDFMDGKTLRHDHTIEETKVRTGGYARPEIAANNTDVIVTCVRGPEHRSTGGRELVSFLKDGLNPFEFQTVLHRHALGSGAVIMDEGGVRVGAWCAVDDVKNPPTRILAFTYKAQPLLFGLQNFPISNSHILHCWRVSLAAIGFADNTVFAFSELDNWATTGSGFPGEAYLEPAQ